MIKNKKLALSMTKRACKGGLIMKKIVLLFGLAYMS